VYQNELLGRISRRKEMPHGFDKEQWHRLVILEASPSHAQTSAKAQVANASRINHGRTGLKGIAGMTHDLVVKLGRDPDLEELKEELSRGTRAMTIRSWDRRGQLLKRVSTKRMLSLKKVTTPTVAKTKKNL
jgi:hypothetical protein